MKPRHLPLLLLLPAASVAAIAPAPTSTPGLPEFSHAEIGLPPLSLADGAKQALPDVFRDRLPPLTRRESPSLAKQLTPGLLVPKRDVDPKMIVPPDPAIDVKILVVPPSREVDAK